MSSVLNWAHSFRLRESPSVQVWESHFGAREDETEDQINRKEYAAGIQRTPSGAAGKRNAVSNGRGIVCNGHPQASGFAGESDYTADFCFTDRGPAGRRSFGRRRGGSERCPGSAPARRCRPYSARCRSGPNSRVRPAAAPGTPGRWTWKGS